MSTHQAKYPTPLKSAVKDNEKTEEEEEEEEEESPRAALLHSSFDSLQVHHPSRTASSDLASSVSSKPSADGWLRWKSSQTAHKSFTKDAMGSGSPNVELEGTKSRHVFIRDNEIGLIMRVNQRGDKMTTSDPPSEVGTNSDGSSNDEVRIIGRDGSFGHETDGPPDHDDSPTIEESSDSSSASESAQASQFLRQLSVSFVESKSTSRSALSTGQKGISPSSLSPSSSTPIYSTSSFLRHPEPEVTCRQSFESPDSDADSHTITSRHLRAPDQGDTSQSLESSAHSRVSSLSEAKRDYRSPREELDSKSVLYAGVGKVPEESFLSLSTAATESIAS